MRTLTYFYVEIVFDSDGSYVQSEEIEDQEDAYQLVLELNAIFDELNFPALAHVRWWDEWEEGE